MNYNDHYYIISQNFENSEHKVIPTESTSLKRFHYREQIYGQQPLKFITHHATILNSKPQMFFCTPSIIISDSLKCIFNGNIYGGKLYPSIVASKTKTEEGYLLINIYKKLDCWNRDKSIFEQNDPDDLPHVIKYHLDSDILDHISETERLIFKIGGDDLSPIIVHEKLKTKIEKIISYVNFFPINEYSLGDEY